jgi:ankyrin repeat protein
MSLKSMVEGFRDRSISLAKAIENGALVSSVKNIVRDGGDPNTQLLGEGKGITPLFVAAAEGNVGLIRTLKTMGADVHKSDEDGYKPIHFANGSISTVELSAGGSLADVLSKFGETPLHAAASNGDAEKVNTLLAMDANPQMRGPSDRTPLHEAVLSFDSTSVHLLLHGGADPNAKDLDGMTPLHYATLYDGNAEQKLGIVRSLILDGADPDMKDNDGDTPRHFAQYKEQENVLRTMNDACQDVAETKKANEVEMEI